MLTVICGRPDGQDEAIGPPISPVLAEVGRFTDRVVFAGRFPGADIDNELTDRVVVVGEVSQLAAVVLRLLRRGRLGSPTDGPPASVTAVGYIALQRNGFTDRWDLPVGTRGVEVACTAATAPIPLLRNDNGGVLLDAGVVESPTATVYVDETLVLRGSADRLVVRPAAARGLTATLEWRRALRLPPKRQEASGRAVSIGFDTPTLVRSDGVDAPRPLPRWTWYAHTEPLHLARPVGR